MTRRYETVYIFDSALDETAVNERLARFHALLGPEVQPTVSHWGKRTLTYKIRHKEVGYYVVAQFEAEPAVLPEFERAIKLEEGVLGFLVVLIEGEQPRTVPAETAVGAEEDDE